MCLKLSIAKKKANKPENMVVNLLQLHDSIPLESPMECLKGAYWQLVCLIVFAKYRYRSEIMNLF